MQIIVYFSDSESASFSGKGRIIYDLSGQGHGVQTKRDHLKMRFRTNSANGLMFFADGNQGDYIAIEMLRGSLNLHIDLGLFTFNFKMTIILIFCVSI